MFHVPPPPDTPRHARLFELLRQENLAHRAASRLHARALPDPGLARRIAQGAARSLEPAGA